MTNFFHPSPLGQLDALYMSVGSIPCNHSLLSCEKKSSGIISFLPIKPIHLHLSRPSLQFPFYEHFTSITFHFSNLCAVHLNYLEFMKKSPQSLSTLTLNTFHFHLNYFPLSPRLLSTFTLTTFHFHINYFSLSTFTLITCYFHLNYFHFPLDYFPLWRFCQERSFTLCEVFTKQWNIYI